MAEGDAWSEAKRLELTLRRIRFRQTPSLQEESYSKYSRELAESLDRLVPELNGLLAGLCRIKSEPNGIEILQEKDDASTSIGSLRINYQPPRHVSFQYLDKGGQRAEEAFFLDPAGADYCLFYNTPGHQGFTTDELASHVMSKELQIVDQSIQHQLRQRAGMG
ncbi:MAG: hypothetical protein ABI163_15490 [Thermoanaerobaculia bacterium]